MKRFLATTSLALVFGSSSLFAVSHAVYDTLLKQHVSDDGWVDYSGIQNDSLNALNTYLEELTNADLSKLRYEARLAFWINAYNAHALKIILMNPSLQKIDKEADLFDKPIKVAGDLYSLNDIEHRIIRGKTNSKNNKGPILGVTLERFDPRVHFALVCGAVSCPKLRPFAYTEQNVNQTLTENARFFASSRKYIRIEKDQLVLSSLLLNYGEDFRGFGGVPAYLTQLLDQTQRPDRRALKKQLRLNYAQAHFQYDWTLNDIRNKK